jgi:ribose transport system permease protein
MPMPPEAQVLETTSGAAAVAAPAGRWRQSPADLRRTAGPIVALLSLIVVFTILNSNFLLPDNLLNITRQAAVLLVIALAGTFPVLLGSIDLSVGSTATVGAITGAIIFRDKDSVVLFLVLVPAFGALAGAINGLLIAYARLPSFLVTLGTQFAFNGAALYASKGQPIPVDNAHGLDELYSGALLGIPNAAILAVALLALSIFIARQTRFGRYVYAIGGSENAARLSGVPIARYKLLVYVLGGTLAAIAGGMLMLRVGSGAPGTGDSFLLTSIAAIVMGGTPLTGGVGGPARTLLGVIIIAVLANGMSVANIDPFMQVIVQGVVVILAVALTIDRGKLSLIK